MANTFHRIKETTKRHSDVCKTLYNTVKRRISSLEYSTREFEKRRVVYRVRSVRGGGDAQLKDGREPLRDRHRDRPPHRVA